MPPVRKKQTYYKNEWLHSEELDFNIWLKIGTDNTSFRCKICKTNKDLALGQSGIGSLKKHGEGDTYKKNMMFHKKTLNFFQPSSSKSIVIEDDDVIFFLFKHAAGLKQTSNKTKSIYIWPGCNIHNIIV